MTHRHRLRSARAFYAWCIERDYVTATPFARVKAVGRVNTGKLPLRLDEVRKLVDVLSKHADTGHEVAAALLLLLVHGVRSSEILQRQIRDLDDGGRILWIPHCKTKNARRRLPSELADLGADELRELVALIRSHRSAA